MAYQTELLQPQSLRSHGHADQEKKHTGKSEAILLAPPRGPFLDSHVTVCLVLSHPYRGQIIGYLRDSGY